MGDIQVVDVQAKGIEVFLSIPLESLKKIVKCINNSEVDLPDNDEAYVYFATEFYPDLEDIIKTVGGKEE